MQPHVVAGSFYEFDRERARFEIGDRVSRNAAIARVQVGRDVYTLASSDAKSLAKDVYPGKAYWEGSHVPKGGDWDYGLSKQRFPHFHPGGNHDDYGHVFYGQRGYRVDECRK